MYTYVSKSFIPCKIAVPSIYTFETAQVYSAVAIQKTSFGTRKALLAVTHNDPFSCGISSSFNGLV